jgi:homoserine kinase
MTPSGKPSYEVRVPASTANLGAGFDCLGLALDLHLTVRATILRDAKSRSFAHTRGVAGSENLPSGAAENLILRAMSHTAKKQGFILPAVSLDAHNEIPIAGGLGSSAAAIVAGIALAYAISGRKMTEDAALGCATALESHVDNVGAALLGGFIASMVRPDGSAVAIRRSWPKQIRVVAITPEITLKTSSSRAVLPPSVPHADAVFNLQRSSLFLAALEAKRHDLLADAMRDRLHQPYRQRLIPGLASVLSMPLVPGMVGIALSGSGPTVVALATSNFEKIGVAVANKFKEAGLDTVVRNLAVVHSGMKIFALPERQKK